MNPGPVRLAHLVLLLTGAETPQERELSGLGIHHGLELARHYTRATI